MFHPPLLLEFRPLAGSVGQREVARRPLARVRELAVEQKLNLNAVVAIGAAKLSIDVLMTLPQPPHPLAG